MWKYISGELFYATSGLTYFVKRRHSLAHIQCKVSKIIYTNYRFQFSILVKFYNEKICKKRFKKF